jgi:hypothetical protein
MRTESVMVLLLAAMMTRGVKAQADATDDRNLPERFTWLWEYTAFKWMAKPSDPGVPIAVEVGPLVRVGRRNGIGWTGSFDLTHDIWFVATGPRYRRWLDRRAAFNVGASIPVAGNTRSGPIVEVGLSYADLVGITTRWEFFTPRGVSWGVGAELGSGAGAVATFASAIVIVVTIIRWSGVENIE